MSIATTHSCYLLREVQRQAFVTFRYGVGSFTAMLFPALPVDHFLGASQRTSPAGLDNEMARNTGDWTAAFAAILTRSRT